MELQTVCAEARAAGGLHAQEQGKHFGFLVFFTFFN